MSDAAGSPGLREKRQGLARILLAVALIIIGLWTLRSFLPALAWAAVIAIAIGPLYRRAEKRWPPRGHNILLPSLFTAAVALVFILPLVLVGIGLAREGHDAAAWYEAARTTGLAPPDILAHLPFGSQAAGQWWQDNLGTGAAASEFLKRLESAPMIEMTRQIGAQVVRRVVVFIFTLVTLFFLFRDGDSIAAQLRIVAGRLFGPHGERVGAQIIASVHGTVNGLVLVGLGEGVLIGLAYLIAGVPHPVTLGALTGVAAMIPFAAPVIFIIAALLLVSAGSIGWAIAILVFGFVVVFVADHAVRPVLIGGATKLPFLWVLLGILGGVETFNLLGLFLGPAIMAALMLLWRDYAVEGAMPET